MLKSKDILTLFVLLFFVNLTKAQNSTIELTSSNFSQPVGYKQIGENHTITVANRVNNTNSEIIVTKLNNQHRIIWSKAISISVGRLNKAYSFIVDRDSNVVIVGAVEGISSFLLKLNGSNGNNIYAKQTMNKTGSKSDRLFKIYQMDKLFSDDYVVSGIMGFPDKHVVARFQKNGSQVWCNEYDISNKHELIYALAESAAGDIVLGGHIKNSNYDHAVIKLNPSNGSLIKIQTYNLGYSIYNNGGFDDAVAITGTDNIAFSLIVNDISGKPAYQGVLLYNTRNDQIEKSQLYSINSSARGPNIAYDPVSKSIIIGGVFLDVGNNNLFFQVIELNDLKKSKTYKLKNINYRTQSSNAAYVSVDDNQNLLVSAYISENTNLNLSSVLLGKYRLSGSECLEEVTTDLLNLNVPSATGEDYKIVSTPSFSGETLWRSENDYKIDTICIPDCVPTEKLFRINTPKNKDTICENETYELPVTIYNNVYDSLIKVVLYKKKNNAFGRIDSFKHNTAGLFNLISDDSISEYMIIGKSKCSFNDTAFFTLYKHRIHFSGLTSGGVYCQNETVKLALNFARTSNRNATLNYEWRDSASDKSIGTSTDLNFRAQKPLVITLKLFDNCSSPVILKTRIYAAPPVVDSVILTKKSGCEPLFTEFIHPKTQSFASDNIPFSWVWEIQGNSVYSTSTTAGRVESNIPHVFPTAGNYLVSCKMVFTGGKTCNVYYDSTRVYKSAIADFNFNPDKVEISDPEVIFDNKSRNASNYYWQLSDTSYTTFAPVHRFNQLGVFKVMLIAYADNSCNDTLWKQIEINDDFRMFLPTAFSPNGDGLNDVWIPTFSSINFMEISIFNRWGEQLLKSDNESGWDGTYMGEICQDGVYVFIIKVKSKRDKWYAYSGTLTLLR
jgi:gliding motility-associated-like protein